MTALERNKTTGMVFVMRPARDGRGLPVTIGPQSQEKKHEASSQSRIFLKDHLGIFDATAKSLNWRELTDISITEDQDQTRDGEPLDKEKVRLIIQDRKQSGYLDRFFAIAFDAVLVRSMMREEKISEEEHVERLQKLIDERASSIQISVGNDNRGKKPRAQTVFWKKRKNYVSK